MGLINKAKTVDWPEGLVHLVASRLKKKFQLVDTISHVELRQMLNKVSMNDEEDPAALFEQLSSIENKYDTSTRQIDEEDLIAVILDAAPKEYKSVLTAEQRVKKTALQLSDLEEAMNQHWHQIKKDDEDNAEEKGKELTLSAFNGKCFNCGEMGHRANKCPHGKKKFAGTCHNCGEQGHKSRDCWEKEENKSKRPSYFKPKKEQSTAAVESSGSRMEALLCGLSAPESQEITQQPKHLDRRQWSISSHDSIC